MGPYIPGIDVPIGCRTREREGRPRRPLIRLVGGHRARRPWLPSMGEKLGHVGLDFQRRSPMLLS